MFCQACGWKPIGVFIEVDATPAQIERMSQDDIAALVETKHFLEQRCSGRIEQEPDAPIGSVGGRFAYLHALR